MMTLIVPIPLAAWGLYRKRFSLSVWDDLPRIVGAGLIAAAATLLAFVQWISQTTEIVTTLAAGLAVLIAARAVAYHVIRSARTRGMGREHAVIIGGGQVASSLGERIAANPELGLELTGYLEEEPMLPAHSLEAPVLGTPSQLAQILEDEAVGQVIVAFSSLSSADLVKLIRTASRAQAEVSVVPRLFELSTTQSVGDNIAGIPVVRLRRSPFRSLLWPAKRAADVLLSGGALLLLSPMLILLAAVLRITDGPGVLFRQQRVGLDGREFDLLKFRSMRAESENESQTLWTVKSDSRVTKVGRVLRKTSLDELPQFINVLRGDMSLVGPRPERPHFVEIFSEADDRYPDRHRVHAGLTGWAQIHGLRGDTSIRERARYDNYYIENWSLWLDVKIMARTLSSLMRGAG